MKCYLVYLDMGYDGIFLENIPTNRYVTKIFKKRKHAEKYKDDMTYFSDKYNDWKIMEFDLE